MFALVAVAAAVAMLGGLIIVHEFGHFYAARAAGIEVAKFSVGLGPVLWSRTDRHGCAWQLRLFPFGGFVYFLGSRRGGPIRPGDEDASALDGIPVDLRRRCFQECGPGARALVVAGGPLINLLLGLFVIAAIYAGNGKPFSPPVIAEVVAGSPADKAGLLPGDLIVSVDGVAIASFADVFDAVGFRGVAKLQFEVARAGSDGLIQSEVDLSGPLAKGRSEGRKIVSVGIASGPVEFRRVGPLTAIAAGFDDSYKITAGALGGVVQIITGERSVKELGGPLTIVEMSGNAVRIGFVAWLIVFAILSINVGVFNLLPIPALDGGHLIVCAIEAVTRRPVSQETLFHINRYGAAFMLSLFTLVTANEVMTRIAWAFGLIPK